MSVVCISILYDLYMARRNRRFDALSLCIVLSLSTTYNIATRRSLRVEAETNEEPKGTDISNIENVGKIAAFVAFDRYEYFEKSFKAFSRCFGSENYDVAVFLDGAPNSTERTFDDIGRKKIRDYVKNSEWLSSRGLSVFRSVRLEESDENVGVWKNKKRAVEKSMETHEFAIVIEDDVVMSRDAIRWLEFPLTSGTYENRKDVAIATCWSTSFPKTNDSKLAAFDRLSVDALDMRYSYYENQWATPWGWSVWRETWKTFGKEWSGQDLDLSRLFGELGFVELMPLVSRCDNVGIIGNTMRSDDRGTVHARELTSDDFDVSYDVPFERAISTRKDVKSIVDSEKIYSIVRHGIEKDERSLHRNLDELEKKLKELRVEIMLSA